MALKWSFISVHIYMYIHRITHFFKFSDLFMFEHELGSHFLFMFLLVSVLILLFKWWRL